MLIHLVNLFCMERPGRTVAVGLRCDLVDDGSGVCATVNPRPPRSLDCSVSMVLVSAAASSPSLFRHSVGSPSSSTTTIDICCACRRACLSNLLRGGQRASQPGVAGRGGGGGEQHKRSGCASHIPVRPRPTLRRCRQNDRQKQSPSCTGTLAVKGSRAHPHLPSFPTPFKPTPKAPGV